ncbi:hypothetical protein SDC9_197501 [bioreactor metagenome]|uniref:Uncharacterized protein n=1 Tax=bioreactor metagenome TaxID=1076179 RepID=A0A645IF12_9ZZZZ
MSYLSLFGILSGRFAKLFGCAGYIEDIIYYLERRTYVCAILVTAAEKIFIVGPECRSPCNCCPYQRAGLKRGYFSYVVRVVGGRSCVHVQDLSSAYSGRSYSAAEYLHCPQ